MSNSTTINSDCPRRQFGIRTLLLASTAAAVALVFWRVLLLALLALFWLETAAFSALAFAIGRRFGVGSDFAGRFTGYWRLSIVVLWLLLAAAILALLVRYRWLTLFYDDQWPRPWPYPDLYLMELHDSLDKRYPAPPGYFKIHGEYERVLLVVNGLAAAWVTMAAGMLGTLSRTLRSVEGLLHGGTFCVRAFRRVGKEAAAHLRRS